MKAESTVTEDVKKIKKLNQKIQAYNYKCFAFDEKYGNTNMFALRASAYCGPSAYFFGNGLFTNWARSDISRISRKQVQLGDEYDELQEEMPSNDITTAKPFWKVKKNNGYGTEFYEKNEKECGRL